jgi:hypothetical protein
VPLLRGLAVVALVLALHTGATAAPPHDGVLRARALEGLLDAVRTEDEAAMWAALSRVGRHRLGPTLAEFRARGARGVRSSLAPFVGRTPRVVVNEAVDRKLGVIAIVGGRTRAAFAVPVRLEQGTWKIELDPAFTVEAVRPLPDDRVRRRTQLFAEVAAPGRIDGSGMWFDGVPFYARRYWSPDGRHMSMWDEAPQPLAKGWHSVVAFASAGQEAAANAWVFTVR